MSGTMNFLKPEKAHSMHEELRHLASSLADIVRGIRTAQEPILDSQRKVPQATEQLERITRQTEDAAHRVLDVAEGITSRETEIESLLKQLRRALPATYFRNNSKVKAIVERIRECASQNQNAAYDIMDALQFQDITSQQIDHAISLLEHVQERLHEVLRELAGENQGADVASSRRERAYDPNAHFSTGSGQQSSVDELISNLSQDTKRNSE